jgi:DNA replication protein DnaC
MTYREMLIKNLTDKRPSSFQNRIAGASNIDSSINRLLDKLNALELIFPASYEKVNSFLPVIQDSYCELEMNFVFTGAAGSGKTYLMRIIKGNIYDLATEPGLSLKPMCWQLDCRTEYANYLAEKQDGKNYTPHTSSRFCFIDDLGDEKPDTDAARSWIANMIQARYDYTQRHKQCSTIITTNLSAKELTARYGQRVIDRLMEMCPTWLVFTNKSFRTRNFKILEG